MGIFQNALLAGAAAAASGNGEAAVPGYLYVWGQNNVGQLGNGTTSNAARTTPLQLGSDKYIACDTGQYNHVAIKEDGTMWGWGSNAGGQLGQGNTTTYSSPVQFGSASNWTACATGRTHTGAVNSDGELWVCGNVAGTTANSLEQEGSLTDWKTIDAGTGNFGAVKTDGTLWTWGTNTAGTLGDGGTGATTSPNQVGSNTNWKIVTMGNQHALAVTTDGELFAWGQNNNGMLGQGNTTNYSSPVQVGSLTSWTFVRMSALSNMSNAISAGRFFSFGSWNNYGEVGVGNKDVTYSSPVQVGSDTDWFFSACGEATGAGIKGADNSGARFSWGNNGAGMQGVGNQTESCSPVQVGSDTDWISGSYGEAISSGIKLEEI